MLLTASIPPDKQFTSDIGTWTKANAAIVVIETDEGITGYSEAKGSPVVMKSIIEEELKPLLIGEDPSRVTYLWEKMFNGTRLGLSLYYGRSQPRSTTALGEVMCAISGIDVALWDVFGKAMNVPAYRLMGGAVRDRIKAYASGGHGRVGEIGPQLAGYVSRGFKAVKMRVGGMDYPDMIAGSRARVKEARETLGPGIQIMLDAHGSTGVTDAIELGHALEEYRIAWYEEPVIYHNLRGMAEVRRSIRIPVATGENTYTRYGFRDLADARAADVWQPDIAIAGGLTEIVRIAALAAANDIQLAPHAWGSALLWAASLQLAAAVPNYYILEFPQAYSPLLTDLIDVSVKVEEDGCVPIPSGPGLGVQIDPEAEKRFPFEGGGSQQKPLI
jgi:L-alanine-DL-glutamate epimerase-like enolase superfamily enzyme